MDDLQLLPLRETTRRLTKRGVDARKKIIDAMVTCIGRHGFAATTVEHVICETGLSRGSVLHQFRNRVELAAATAEHTMRFAMADSLGRANAIDDPFERVLDYAQIMWDTQSQPEGIALSDILLATRWDKELAAAIRPITLWVEQEVARALLKLAVDADFVDPPAFVPHGWLLLATVRGLVIEFSFSRSRPMILAAAEVMKQQHRQLCITMARRPS
jgi:AcrR family transcriptional regulator